MHALLDESLTLEAGTITFVPRANHEAFKIGKRIFEGNLVRSIIKKNIADCTYHEEKVAQHIIPLIEEADYILDLHSCSAQTPAFVFQDTDTPEAEDFCTQLGSDFVIVGWNDYFSNDTIPASVQAYGNKIGKVCATVECGSHLDPASVDAGIKMIMNAGRYLSMFAENHEQKPTRGKQYRLIHHFWEDAPGELAQNFTGLHPLKKGEHIVTYMRDGIEDKRYAEQDCYILMPSKNGYSPDQNNMDVWTYLVAPV